MKPKQMVLTMVTLLAVFCLLVGPAMAEDMGKVNINTASVDELAQLKKVGPKIAERIVDYRDAYGPFKAPEDLMQVKGIGEKVFELNKDRIVVEDEQQG